MLHTVLQPLIVAYVRFLVKYLFSGAFYAFCDLVMIHYKCNYGSFSICM